MNKLPSPKVLIKYIPAFIIVAALFIFLLALVNYAGNGGLKRDIADLNYTKAVRTAAHDDLNEEILYLHHLNDVLSEAKQEYYNVASALEKEVVEGKSPYRIAYLTFDDGPFRKTQDYLEEIGRASCRERV